MEKEFIEKMQKKLLEEKSVIMKALADQYAESKKIVEAGETGDEADIASDVVDGKMLESLGKADANRLQMINNALDRIKQNKYGFCLACKKEIPIERLEVLPYAFMCVNCQSINERRNR